jgi:hypothetical protein
MNKPSVSKYLVTLQNVGILTKRILAKRILTKPGLAKTRGFFLNQPGGFFWGLLGFFNFRPIKFFFSPIFGISNYLIACNS